MTSERTDLPRVRIRGAGHFVPPKVVKNADLPGSLNCSSDWVEKRTGVLERRYADEGIYPSDLAVRAAESAIEDAGLEPDEIDCIIAATLSPDHFFPGMGVYVQAKLGVCGVPAYDVRAQCSGFLYALNMAQAFVRAGTYRRVLITCAEIQSRLLGDLEQHRSVSPLFGDGAGAVVVCSEDEQRGRVSLDVGHTRVYADGSGADQLRLRLFDFSIRHPLDWERLDGDPDVVRHCEMDGQFVFRRAVQGMAQAARDVLKEEGVSLEDVAWLLPHQANLNISRSVAFELGFPWERVCNNIERYGNTTAASIPILLSETLQSGKVELGDRLLCAAFGSGLTWGGAMLTAT